MEKKDKKICKCDQYLDGWKRAKADFLNYKKGEENRIQDRVGYSNQKMILNIMNPLFKNIPIYRKPGLERGVQLLIWRIMQTNLVF